MIKFEQTSRLALLALAGVIALSASGCATIISGSTQDVAVQTPPTQNAKCELTNDKGDATIEATPGSAIVHKSGNSLTITCMKGNLKNTRTVSADLDPWVFGNILFGGLIGLGIDYVSGALHKYPADVQMPLSRD